MATAEKPIPLKPLRERLGVTTPAEAVTWINAMFYGEAGAGKTYLSGTAQDSEYTAPAILFDIEGGTTTLRHRKDLDILRVTDVGTLKSAWEQMRHETYYRTAIVDSLSELNQLIMQGVLVLRNEKRPDLAGEPPSMREWGISGDITRQWVRRFRDLECNVIFTCLSKTEKDDRSGVVKTFPALPGQLQAQVPGFLDIVGYMRTKEQEGDVVRLLQTTGSERVVAKDRTGSLPSVIENPSIPEMWRFINESA